MNILILNAEAGGNKGAEAMLEILITKLLEEMPDVNLFLEVGQRKKYYTDVFLKRFNARKIQLLKFSPKKIFTPYGKDTDIIDIAIDIGGINFHDNGLFKDGLRNLIRFKPFLKNKKKLIFFTQDIGPSKKWYNIMIGKYILSKAAVIFSRSENSYTEIINTFKIDKQKVFGPFPDSTLLYRPTDTYKGKVNGNHIVLSPSSIMYTKYGEEYLNLFIKLYQRLKDRYQVVILVHNFTLNFNSSDQRVCAKLHDLCPTSLLINENISASKLKNILSTAKFSISSRYHVVVGSVSQNTPSIAIGWNPKYESFLKLYNKNHWNINFGTNAFKEIDNLIEDKDFSTPKNDLSKSNNVLKEEVLKSFELLYSSIEQN